MVEEVDAADNAEQKPRPLAPWIVLAVAVVLGGLFIVLVGASPGTGETADSPLIGRPAPEATGTLGVESAFI